MDAIYIFGALVLWNFVSTSANQGAAPLLQLSDGNMMPTFALGTWLGNNTMGRIVPEGHEVEQAVLWAFQAGYRHVDTAWAYAVEDQVGRAVKNVMDRYKDRQEITTTPKICNAHCYLKSLKKRIERTGNTIPALQREEIFITTKLWNDAHARDAVVPALEESLEELQMSYVDLYLMHWPLGQFENQTYDTTHYIETWRGMMDARELNLTRSIGVSNFNLVMLENIRAHGLMMPAVLQIEWNLNLQQPELLVYCRQQGIAVMGYTPFGSLMKKHQADKPTSIDDPTLTKMAAKYRKTVPQLLLRFAVDMGVTPTPKTLNGSRIFENIDIFDFKLHRDDLNTLKSFDRHYRTIPQLKWKDHPFYPFERVPDTTTTTSTESTETTETTRVLVDSEPVKINFRDIKN